MRSYNTNKRGMRRRGRHYSCSYRRKPRINMGNVESMERNNENSELFNEEEVNEKVEETNQFDDVLTKEKPNTATEKLSTNKETSPEHFRMDEDLYSNSSISDTAQTIKNETTYMFVNQYGNVYASKSASSIRIEESGMYRIDYVVSIEPNISVFNLAHALALDELEYQFTCFRLFHNGRPLGETMDLVGSLIVEISAGETITLRKKEIDSNRLVMSNMQNQFVNATRVMIQKQQ